MRTSEGVVQNASWCSGYQIFANAASVVTLVDRLVHRSEVVIEGESWRLKEAKERGESWKNEQRWWEVLLEEQESEEQAKTA
jgi:hypothetical protein